MTRKHTAKTYRMLSHDLIFFFQGKTFLSVPYLQYWPIARDTRLTRVVRHITNFEMVSAQSAACLRTARSVFDSW